MGNEHPYVSISLRRELATEIEQYIKTDKRYSSITDFITESIRLRLNELKTQFGIIPKEALNG